MVFLRMLVFPLFGLFRILMNGFSLDLRAFVFGVHVLPLRGESFRESVPEISDAR